jgi:oligosaccharyltransferase complex subunit alpha (ribophorin I)
MRPLFTQRSNRKRKSSMKLYRFINPRFNGMLESYTKGDQNAEGQPDPTKAGNVLTYGPYDTIHPSTFEEIKVHYEYTFPITFIDVLERDIQVSNWGTNVAMEERYQLTNHAAKSFPFKLFNN